MERSILEAVFARGDRRLADTIEYAYKAGARFDGWDECSKADIWAEAFDATGVDPAWYAHREHPADEVFPWDHLHCGPPNEYLRRQYDDTLAKTSTASPQPTGVSAYQPGATQNPGRYPRSTRPALLTICLSQAPRGALAAPWVLTATHTESALELNTPSPGGGGAMRH